MRLNRTRIHLMKEGEDFKRQVPINKMPQAIFKLSSLEEQHRFLKAWKILSLWSCKWSIWRWNRLMLLSTSMILAPKFMELKSQACNKRQTRRHRMKPRMSLKESLLLPLQFSSMWASINLQALARFRDMKTQPLIQPPAKLWMTPYAVIIRKLVRMARSSVPRSPSSEPNG